MTDAFGVRQTGVKPARVSYVVIFGTLALAGWLHLATLLLASLFSYLALTRLHFIRARSKWLALGLFLILLAGVAYELGHFINHAVRALPEIADRAIPSIIRWAKQCEIELPFTDYDSLKDLAFGAVTNEVNYLGRFANIARGATRQFVFLAAGCVIAISLFLKPQLELAQKTEAVPNNLYSLCCQEIAERFRLFYCSFETVMGAQIVISLINTVLTTIFVLFVGLPYAPVVIGVTFLCGLVQVIGNLVIGERLMGVPGMILAPVVLNYLKLEASSISFGIKTH